MRAEIAEAVRLGAEDVAAKVRQLAPVSRGKKSGKLKASVRTRDGNLTVKHAGRRKRAMSGPDKKNRTAWYVLAGSDEAYYAHMVEFGTAPHENGGFLAGTKHPGTVPQPFFLPAWRMRRKYVKNRIGRAVSKAVRQVLRGT